MDKRKSIISGKNTNFYDCDDDQAQDSGNFTRDESNEKNITLDLTNNETIDFTLKKKAMSFISNAADIFFHQPKNYILGLMNHKSSAENVSGIPKSTKFDFSRF